MSGLLRTRARLEARICADLRSISRTRSGRERASKWNGVVKQDI